MANEDSQQQNNTDSLAAAREARRRRILENSNNRLGKITGRLHNEEIPKIETTETNGVYQDIYPDPDMERDVFEGTNALSNTNNQDVFELLKTLQQEKSNKTEEVPKQQIPQSLFAKFVRSKYPVIIIALLVYALYALNIDGIIGGSVFSLFIIWEIFEFILTAFIIKEAAHQNQLIAIIGMFLGLSPHSLQLIIKILGLFNKILRDVAIFLFTFVFTHLLYSYLIIGDSMSEILDKDFNRLLTRDEL